MRRIALTVVLLAAGAVWLFATGASTGAPRIYKVTAIFDNAGFAVPGEDVRIAGAPVGSIQSLDLWPDRHGKQAAVTIEIDKPAFTPFYANATCAIRPQSLIAERYVNCLPGSSSSPALTKITTGVGSGTYLLPVSQTRSPIDSDVVQNIYQEPIRQRFSIILNELGTGLAARGSDLNAVIHRANPALGYTDQVLQILARQDRTLAALARDGDTVLKPLAAAKRQLADFIVQANAAAVASAERAPDIARSIQLFPGFLRQLRPLMVALGNFADQGTPLLGSLGQSATALGRQFNNLIPFAKAARPSLIALGKSSAQSQPALLATLPLAHRLQSLGTQAVPSAKLLDKLTASLDRTGAIEQLMALLFNGTEAGNAFDSLGHYVRDELNVGACTTYSISPINGCSANFNAFGAARDASASTTARIAATAVRSVAATSTRPKHTSHNPDLLRALVGYLLH